MKDITCFPIITFPESAQKEDFDEVTHRLNSPTLVSSYLEDNFIVKRKLSHNPDAREVFSDMSGDCDEYAILATYWLEQSGYEAYVLKVDFNKWWEEYNCWRRHDICAYKGKDDLYYSVDIYFHGSGRNPIGPFNSIAEICDQLPSHYGATDWIKYQLFDSKWSLVKTETKPDFLGPNARKLCTFKEIVPLLDTPDKVSAFMENNIKWDGSYDKKTAGINEWVPAWVVYERGIDDCDGHATIQAYFLKANGYDAWNVGIGIGGPKGHGVCVYLDNGLYWMLDNCGAKKGPFNSLDELGDSVISGASIIIFDPFNITSPTRKPFQLPHTVYRK